jgi:threonine/homoserine/homoserine lactone efflux protein
MFGTHDLWAFLAASVVLWLTPGPDTMYILARSIVLGRRAGVMSALGIGSGLLIHTLLAAFGLSAIRTGPQAYRQLARVSPGRSVQHAEP